MKLQIPDDVTVVEHGLYRDSRGFLNCLIESDSIEQFPGYSLKMSRSMQNVARGIHWQKPVAPQEKIITLLHGAILDVMINLDSSSKDFGSVYRFELRAEDQISLIIPAHYGHGFVALLDTDFLYLCKGKYSAKDEITLRIADYISDVVPEDQIILSEKDKKARSFTDSLHLLK